MYTCWNKKGTKNESRPCLLPISSSHDADSRLQRCPSHRAGCKRFIRWTVQSVNMFFGICLFFSPCLFSSWVSFLSIARSYFIVHLLPSTSIPFHYLFVSIRALPTWTGYLSPLGPSKCTNRIWLYSAPLMPHSYLFGLTEEWILLFIFVSCNVRLSLRASLAYVLKPNTIPPLLP